MTGVIESKKQVGNLRRGEETLNSLSVISLSEVLVTAFPVVFVFSISSLTLLLVVDSLLVFPLLLIVAAGLSSE